MEEEFQFQTQPLVLDGGGETSSAADDEAYINSICGGLSFRSLLTYGSFEPATETRNPLKLPKTEPVFTVENGLSGEAPPYNFFSEMMTYSLPHHHQQLPSLQSFELPQNVDSPMPNPRAERSSYGKQRWRRQHQRLSDKTRCLQKLLPLDEKMDMATVLEEAYKYIQFLQAQVSVLQSMPCDSSNSAAAANFTTASIGGGDLGRLNRQQLLQVVVNSPVAQTQLYSKGCCLYSMEQLILLKKNAERKALYHQMMMLHSSNPNSTSFLS